MQDKPSAEELLEAVQEFLMKDILPIVKDQDFIAYKTLVSWNMLGIIVREIRNSPLPEKREEERRQAKEFAEIIKHQKLSIEDLEVWKKVKEMVRSKLQIANPKILS